MKNFLLIVLMTISIPVFAQHDTIMLQQGYPVDLKLLNDINNKTSHVGDKIKLEVNEPIVINNQVVINKGVPALGTITNADRGGYMKKGQFDFTIDEIILPSGKIIQLKADIGQNGKRPGSLLFNGPKVTYKTGKIFIAYIAKDYLL